ncbi:hypothetical protein CF326_g5344 [Tilletia indica]|nr:hypothetical protein CF326_g5344 [Tilletia indica]
MFLRNAGVGISAAAAAASTSSSLSSTSIASTNHAWRSLLQQQQHRTLTSTVLLTRTRELYESRRAVELKDELRQRGLATSGKRNELVRRLLNDDVRKAGSNIVLESAYPSNVGGVRTKTTQASTTKGGAPRTPPTSDSATPNSSTSSSLASLRAQTSDSTSSSANKGAVKPPPETDATTPTVGVIDSNKVMSAGVAIDKDAAADGSTAVAPGLSSPHIKEPVSSNPPGVPPKRAMGVDGPFGGIPDSRVPSFDIKIPYEKPEYDEGPKIPLVTSYFQPGENVPDAVRKADEEYQSNPKVVAVGGSTHTEIAHHATDAAHPPKKSNDDSSSSSASGAITSLLSEFRKDLGLPSPSAVASAASGEKESGNATLDEASKAIRDALASVSPSKEGSSSSGSGSSGSSSKSKSSNSRSSADLNRPLNSDERTGAYLLGAIVFGGLLLGGVAAPADPEKKEKRAERKEKVKEKVAAAVNHVVAPSQSTSATTPRSERGRVGKAMEDVLGVGGSASSANFSTGQGIVGGATRKW